MTASFWGLVVEPNKLYSQVVPAGFKLSMASLGPQEESGGTDSPSSEKKKPRSTVGTTLMVRLDEKDDYALCSLTPGQLNQQALDLVFTEGENIALRVVGDQPVHLTGYYLPDECNDDCDMESDEEYDDEDDEELDSDEDEELDSEDYTDSDDSDESGRVKEITSEEEAVSGRKHGMAAELDSEEESSEASGASTEEELPSKTNNKRAAQAKEEDTKRVKAESKKGSPKPAAPEAVKKPEQSKKDSPKPTKGVDQKTESSSKPEPKAEAAKKPETKQPEKKTLPSGLIIEDIKVGEGIKAQQGRRVGITYKGTLLTTGKTFDTNKGKPLFHFTIGKGEVIKGMDQGVQGMALGGERRITIPSALGYGPKGAPPAIPGDATLVFEIKLEKVTNNNNNSSGK